MLADLFGSDGVAFAVGSDTLPGVTRGFTAFSDAEQENANSRIYGGIHYRFSNVTGIAMGHQVADYVVANFLKPASIVVGEGGAGGEPGEPGAAGGTTGGSAGVAGGATGGSPSGGNAGAATSGGGPSTGGNTGAAGESSSGGSAGASGNSGDDSCGCSVAGGGTSFDVFGGLLLLGAAGLGLRRRRAG